MTSPRPLPILTSSHLLGIEGLSPDEVTALLDLADSYVVQGRTADKKTALLKGRTLINLFYEASTRTQSSFELAAKRLGADVMNMVYPPENEKLYAAIKSQGVILSEMRLGEAPQARHFPRRNRIISGMAASNAAS